MNESRGVDADSLLEALRSDGTVFPVEINVSEVQTGGPRIFSAVLRDITERKESEQRLRESQRAMSTLLSNLPGMAYRCLPDDEWTMLFASDGSAELTGYEPDELISNHTTSYVKLIFHEDRHYVLEETWKAIRTGAQDRLTYRIVHRNSEIRWMCEHGQAVPGSGGGVSVVMPSPRVPLSLPLSTAGVGGADGPGRPPKTMVLELKVAESTPSVPWMALTSLPPVGSE